MNSEVLSRGFAVIPGLLPAAEIDVLVQSLGVASGAGQRGMLKREAVRHVAECEAFFTAVRPYLGGTPRPVRAIFFDKSPDSNWLVAWHQDLTIAVTEPGEAPGFGPWTTKDGISHVQPPVELLQQMITLRLHLDDADESNGALKLLPGTHDLGRLAAADIERLRSTIPEETCRTQRGDALLMRPLLLHASGRSTSDRRRRVLHIEYAGFDLPHGLHWNREA